jgi:hypothetical protein
MKKLFGITLLFFVALLAVIAQVPDTIAVIDPDIVIPEDLMDLLNVNVWFASLNGVAGITVFIAALINEKLLKTDKKLVKKMVAIGIAVVLCGVTSLINFGFLAEAKIYEALLYGVGAGFLANGWYGLPVVKGLLKWIRIVPKDSA